MNLKIKVRSFKRKGLGHTAVSKSLFDLYIISNNFHTIPHTLAFLKLIF